MEVARLVPPVHGNPIHAAVGSLIEAIGTVDFDAQLFRVMRETVRCEHLNALAYANASPPRILAAGSHDDFGLARRVGETYVAGCWQRDPLNRVLKAGQILNEGLTVRATRKEMRTSPYRRECYAAFDWKGIGIKLIDRFSIVKRHRFEIIRINFYRHIDDGPFTPSDLTKIITSADVLFALLSKHRPLPAPRNTDEAKSLYERQLRTIAPTLSSREVQVCTGIALGMTSEAIASSLGISVHTVLTYRKRAYARMQISSQNELLRLMFSTSMPICDDRDDCRQVSTKAN